MVSTTCIEMKAKRLILDRLEQSDQWQIKTGKQSLTEQSTKCWPVAHSHKFRNRAAGHVQVKAKHMPIRALHTRVNIVTMSLKETNPSSDTSGVNTAIKGTTTAITLTVSDMNLHQPQWKTYRLHRSSRIRRLTRSHWLCHSELSWIWWVHCMRQQIWSSSLAPSNMMQLFPMCSAR